MTVDGPVFGSAEGALALVEEALELLGRGGGDIACHGCGQEDVGGRAALAGIAVQGIAGCQPAR